jgi:ATP-binding cassette subfamily F protein uup
MLDRVSTTVLGLDGRGSAERFADYSQWELWRDEQEQPRPKENRASAPSATPAPAKKKLGYLDSRDMDTIEARITEAERELASKRAALDDSAVVTNPTRLQSALAEIETAQQTVDLLYARWAELEAKIG